MKILLYSPAFHPGLGGLETVVAILAEELHRAGEEVVVVCAVPFADPEPFPFKVVRQPGAGRLLSLVRWCEVFFQANVSLKGIWPLLLVRRPWVVSHHSWYRQPDGTLSWRDRLKRRLLRHAAASVSVSRAMAEDLEVPSVVIENPYRDDLFCRLPDLPRDRDLLFVGRLVSDKGCDLLLDALGRLRSRGLDPGLAIVGAGPEEGALRRRIDGLGLRRQVELTGPLAGEALVRILNRHRVLVAPSRYNEPFGIVVLEALACGCQVIGSGGGGLVDAIGPGGWTFPNGDSEALAQRIEAVLRGELPAPDPAAVREHLARHSPRRVAGEYRAVLAAALSVDRSPPLAET